MSESNRQFHTLKTLFHLPNPRFLKLLEFLCISGITANETAEDKLVMQFNFNEDTRTLKIYVKKLVL